MKYEYLMTVAEHQELREIEAAVASSKGRRRNLMNRLRQRAHRARLAEVQGKRQ
jgi:hypothetical protein